ncbi:MAG: RuBisCO large subunit C-terminal-like domain-containing protein, partial [Acidimicrobiales bacterium]
MIRATYELEPAGSAEALAIEASLGMEAGPDFVRGRVVSEAHGVAVIDFPEHNWGSSIAAILSGVVVGEGMETRTLSRCRLAGLELPDGLLPGPAYAAAPGVAVGAIVKPSLGLGPAEVAAVAGALARGGAVLVKDDEMLCDPPWCPLEERVAGVAAALDGSAVSYCANITGPSPTLVGRARRVVDLGATGVMVNAFTQGLEGLLALRQAGLGVPILAHRVGSGPWARNDRFGVTGAVVAQLTRLCGADYVMAGAFGGKLFDSDDDVRAELAAIRGPLGGAPAATAVLGG